jgi:hypothetical protein
MPASTSRSPAGVAVTVLLLVIVGGCTGKRATSTAASPPSSSTTTTTTTAPTTTTTVVPLTAEEDAWLKAIPKLHNTIDKPFTASNINMTRAKMVELGKALGTCSRELRRIGSPSARLQPVYVAVRTACRTYDKGAQCFATAARVSDPSGAVLVGSPEERTQERALDCGFAAQGDGGNLLTEAEAKAAAIEAQLPR